MRSAIGITSAMLLGALAAVPAASARDLERVVEDAVLHVSAELPMEPAQAYRWFVEPERLESWLTAHAEVEPRVGGRYELFWTPEQRGDNSTIGCRITAYAPGELLAFQWRGPVMWKALTNGADPLTHVVVSFAPHGDGTRVHLVHSGWRSGRGWSAAREWQQKAWQGAFEDLQQQARGTPGAGAREH